MLQRFACVFLILAFCGLPATAYTDTKYFSAFTYQQKGILGSDFLANPEFRFENGAKDLYYYNFRTGFLFHPRDWLDLGFYYVFSNEKDITGIVRAVDIISYGEIEFHDFELDLSYTFESDRPYYTNPWEYAHVIGTNFILDRTFQ